MKTFRIIKSTLGDWNNGHTHMRSNCYYKGVATCWVVAGDDCEYVALSRKSDAEKMAAWMQETQYDGVGDCVAMFVNYCIEIEDFETVDKIKEI